MQKKKTVIKITNRGALEGLSLFSDALIGLAAFHNQNPDAKTIDEYRDSLIEYLEKVIVWTTRPNDGTADEKQLAKERKNAKETIKWVKKIWKN